MRREKGGKKGERNNSRGGEKEEGANKTGRQREIIRGGVEGRRSD